MYYMTGAVSLEVFKVDVAIEVVLPFFIGQAVSALKKIKLNYQEQAVVISALLLIITGNDGRFLLADSCFRLSVLLPVAITLCS